VSYLDEQPRALRTYYRVCFTIIKVCVVLIVVGQVAHWISEVVT